MEVVGAQRTSMVRLESRIQGQQEDLRCHRKVRLPANPEEFAKVVKGKGEYVRRSFRVNM